MSDQMPRVMAEAMRTGRSPGAIEADERDYSEDTVDEHGYAYKDDGTPRLLQPGQRAIDGLVDFISNCVDDADAEDRTDLNEMSGVVPDLERKLKDAVEEVLSAYFETQWTMDGVPDVGDALQALGEALGVDVRMLAKEMVDVDEKP